MKPLFPDPHSCCIAPQAPSGVFLGTSAGVFGLTVLGLTMMCFEFPFAAPYVATGLLLGGGGKKGGRGGREKGGRGKGEGGKGEGAGVGSLDFKLLGNQGFSTKPPKNSLTFCRGVDSNQGHAEQLSHRLLHAHPPFHRGPLQGSLSRAAGYYT